MSTTRRKIVGSRSIWAAVLAGSLLAGCAGESAPGAEETASVNPVNTGSIAAPDAGLAIPAVPDPGEWVVVPPIGDPGSGTLERCAIVNGVNYCVSVSGPGFCSTKDSVCESNRCGNGKCQINAGETCRDCPEDCGACPIPCGNGTCDADESCRSCPEDCGTCSTLCGDGICLVPFEDHEHCPQDCGLINTQW